MVIQLVSQAALARLLSPTDYGVFAVAVLVTTLVGYFSEMGGAATLVKNPEVNEQDIRVAFVLQVLIGLTASLGLYLGAGLIADLFRSPESRDVLEILAL
ncbi:MAG TPA: oligosaccharide flippase family protein, partial [Aquabacterium sp.]|nr:oligosaccharide flippase family protein [Aquabacterium sp.]